MNKSQRTTTNFTHTKEYQATMAKMWYFPKNDQRPAVIKWLKKLPKRYSSIVDIGPGDGYYLEVIRPEKYIVFEPNRSFHKDIRSRCKKLGITTKIFSDFNLLLKSQELENCDLILMIHVLFYMEKSQIKKLLPKIKNKPLVIVNPYPERSVTVDFEKLVGKKESIEKVSLKESLLGKPSLSKTANTHFRLPLDVPIKSISQLIAQLTLRGRSKEEYLKTSEIFINKNIHQWKRKDCWQLPQAELLEMYNITIK